jgi:putative membrane protein
MLDATLLPHVNASLNGLGALLLITGYVFIRQQRIAAHKACMIAAFAMSILFLVSYLVYHYQVGSVKFQGTGALRTFYLAILATHSLLAAIVPFLALATLWRALRERFDKHVKIARWTLPIWLYVSITGVVVYWMLYHLEV